jgi:hypothetical protein
MTRTENIALSRDTHLSDDETVAKMGTQFVVTRN